MGENKNMNIVDANIINKYVDNQDMIYNQVKERLDVICPGIPSEIRTAVIYWKVSDRIRKELGALY
jgi:hypothetical protein